jgi:hypothetical protein
MFILRPDRRRHQELLVPRGLASDDWFGRSRASPYLDGEWRCGRGPTNEPDRLYESSRRRGESARWPPSTNQQLDYPFITPHEPYFIPNWVRSCSPHAMIARASGADHQAASRAGLVGLVALIALTAGLLVVLWRRIPVRGDVGLFDPSVIPALLATQIIWYLAWVPGLEQGIVTGIAIAVAARGTRIGVRRRKSSDHSLRPAVPPRAPVARAPLARAPAMEEEVR